ncbi:MAG: hypothetical protein D6730_10570 [Bacteroidetes bacterium]|nr:MAG: hypothetical protein D6730_10570 [Bacteroidota bacterium]
MLLACALLCSTGCSRLYHMPRVPVPLMSEAGEFSASGAYDITTNSFMGEVAFSPLNHLAVVASGNTGNMTDNNPLFAEETDPEIKQSTHHYAEAALGYYSTPMPINSRSTAPQFSWEVYGGYGVGKSDWEGVVHHPGAPLLCAIFGSPCPYSSLEYGKGRYELFFLQGNAGLRNLGILELGLGMRLSQLTYRFDNYSLFLPVDTYQAYYLEHQYRFSIHINRNFRVDVSNGLSIRIASNTDEKFYRGPIHSSVGITYLLR